MAPNQAIEPAKNHDATPPVKLYFRLPGCRSCNAPGFPRNLQASVVRVVGSIASGAT